MNTNPSAATVRIRIRHDLRPGDLGHILALHGELYCASLGWDHTFEGYVADSLAEFAKAFNPERDRLWIAEIVDAPAAPAAAGTRIGVIGIFGRSPTEAQLRWFLVVPEMRGQGLGRRLLDTALAFCRDRGYRTVYLWTVTGLHAAAHLYHAVGFRKTETLTHDIWGATVTEERYDLAL